MTDMTDDRFLEEVGQPFEWLNAIDPRNDSDILTVPFGAYPNGKLHHQQRLWMTDGFTYNGNSYKFIAVMNVGSEPTYAVDSPSGIRSFSAASNGYGTTYGLSGYWFPPMEGDPGWLYHQRRQPQHHHGSQHDPDPKRRHQHGQNRRRGQRVDPAMYAPSR